MAGTIPNLRWPGAILTWDELRASDVIVPLPRRARGVLPPLPVDSASVRQDDPLSRCLHAGVLTGGRLNAALGWCDGALATRLRVPGRGSQDDSSAPSRAQAAVIAHLRQPLWSTDDGLPCDEEGHVAAAAAGTTPASRAARSHRAGRLPPSSLTSAGIAAVRMAYGTAAEAAGVATIAAATAATSRVAEVGMLRVDAETVTHLAGPDAASRLPPLAASPDAMLMHSAPVAVVDAGLRGEGGGGGGRRRGQCRRGRSCQGGVPALARAPRNQVGLPLHLCRAVRPRGRPPPRQAARVPPVWAGAARRVPRGCGSAGDAASRRRGRPLHPHRVVRGCRHPRVEAAAG